jgi:hypothetical protein
MNISYRKNIDNSVVLGLNIKDNDDNKEFIPAIEAKEAIVNIESDIADILYKLKDIKGLALIDDIKKDLEELYDKLY